MEALGELEIKGMSVRDGLCWVIVTDRNSSRHHVRVAVLTSENDFANRLRGKLPGF